MKGAGPIKIINRFYIYNRDQREWVFKVREVKSENKELSLFFEKCKVKKNAFTLFREVQSEKKCFLSFSRSAKWQKMLSLFSRSAK